MSTPRRVLRVIPRFIGGGPERSILALAGELAALGETEDTTVVVLDPPVTPTMLLQARRLGVALVVDPTDATFCDLVDAADVVVLHFWNHPRLYERFGRVELPACRVVVVVHVAGTTVPQVFTSEVAELADALVLTAPICRDSPGATAVHDRIPTIVMPSPIDRYRLEAAVHGRRRAVAPGSVDRPFTVGYVGSLNHGKLHPRIVELCASVTSGRVRFRFVGSGADPEALQRRFDAAGIGDRVRVDGPTEDVGAVLAEFDVFGYPLASSTYSTTDRTLQEAMWVGVMPVVLAGSPVEPMIDHDRTGLIVDQAEWGSVIEALARDDRWRSRLARSARAAARDRFDPERAAHRWLDFVRIVLAAPKRRRAPVFGRTTSTSQRFVCSLGPFGGPFAVSLGTEGGDVAGAEHEISASPAILVSGEGGIVHYLNSDPHDVVLRHWAGLASRADGDIDQLHHAPQLDA
ncbi:MAG: glycosyltransferase [Actinomycetota bacterium]